MGLILVLVSFDRTIIILVSNVWNVDSVSLRHKALTEFVTFWDAPELARRRQVFIKFIFAKT